jgi:hypothetical protein
MTGKWDFLLVHSKDFESQRWITRQCFLADKHYKRLMSITLMDNYIGDEAVKHFFEDKKTDMKMGILETDVVTKLDISAYITLSNMLRKSPYKFNKKTQKLISK